MRKIKYRITGAWSDPVLQTGYECGKYLAVAKNQFGWKIDHIPTGLCMGCNLTFDTRRDAASVASKISSLGESPLGS